MAKQSAEKEPTPFNYEGLYNDDNPLESLGDLDLGDEVEPSEPTEPDEPTDEGQPSEGEPAEDDAAEGEAEEETTEAEADDTTAEDDADADPQAADKDAEGEGDPADAEADGEPAEKPKPREKEPFIPKSRFDQRTAQLRAAERELEEARTKLRDVESAKQKAEREANSLSDEQIQEKMNAANAALLEGKTEEATKLQSEVFTALRQSGQPVESENTQQVDPNKIAADVRDQMTFEQTLEKIYSEYPALNENSDQFDESVSQEAVDLQAFYFQQGHTRAEATERAVAAVSKIHGLQSAQQEAPAPQQSKKASMAKQAQQQAKREKVSKAKKAPPETSGTTGRTSESADSVDVDSLTVEDWASLPDSVRSRLMGDAL
ncbi:hypothetical protein [Vreelandella massiliensis]|uniref:hypothetical protein n=1 Tax=Vreelandella massiliensis TaxID=1816686 RepID=UPI00096A9093|nr:hypothetical protein [Halomonas massiliensis]